MILENSLFFVHSLLLTSIATKYECNFSTFKIAQSNCLETLVCKALDTFDECDGTSS